MHASRLIRERSLRSSALQGSTLEVNDPWEVLLQHLLVCVRIPVVVLGHLDGRVASQPLDRLDRRTLGQEPGVLGVPKVLLAQVAICESRS